VWSLGTALAQGPAPTLQPGDSALWPRAGATSCTIVLGRDRILVEPFARPAWSQAVVFDNGQWFADLPDGRRLTWVPRQTIHVIDGVGADRFTLVHAAWWDLRLPASNPQDDILRSVQNRIDPDSLLRLFISHNHADLEWSRKIQTHLQRQLDYVDSIDCWDDTRISLGEPWQQQIEGAIQRANVAILLLSPDYLASDWVTRVELPKLLERAQNDGVHLFTLVLQPCDFDRHPVLRAFQVVHDPSRALAQMPPLEQDKVLNQLMWQLKGLLSQAMTDRMTAASPWAHPVQAHVPEPMTRPAWAARHGVDEYGYWAEFEVDAQRGPVVQRMRWIAPGEFLMGSPDSEKERYGNERQHRVILTHGYWLAETACTQVMWEAVMGENPSHFKGYPHNPVEQVSWDDVVEKFLPKLNELVPGLKAELPTEAQWEYACRAGVQTPFWFGGQIDTDQVNYCGNYPYTGGQNGEYRKRTVPVKALPSNSWGLYQMHGNVWEWCTDWLSEYPESEVVDPKWSAKPQEQGGHQRVLRGGGWVNNGVYCRSASRDGYHSGAREGFIGFRLARGLADQLASSQPEAGRMRRFK
jgi:formylglycine-generating enzyme required for sulfatase activity